MVLNILKRQVPLYPLPDQLLNPVILMCRTVICLKGYICKMVQVSALLIHTDRKNGICNILLEATPRVKIFHGGRGSRVHMPFIRGDVLYLSGYCLTCCTL